MNNKTQYSIITYLLILLTLFILFFFTKDYCYDLIDNNNQKQLLEETIKNKNKEYSIISEIKSKIDSWNLKDINFDKFLIKFNENELIDYFYSYVSNNKDWVSIDSISLWEWKLNEFWFKQGDIKLVATFTNEQNMIDMINFLLRSEKYNLYIHDFTYPFWISSDKPLQVSIPIKILYKN